MRRSKAKRFFTSDIALTTSSLPSLVLDGGVAQTEYSNDNRGVIQNRERSRQIIDFRDLRYGNITPTDIDGFIEYKGLAFVFLEYKYGDAEMPYGQALAFTRACDAFEQAGKHAAILECHHTISDCTKDIPAADIPTKRIYWRGKWYSGQNRPAGEHLERLIKYVNNHPQSNPPAVP